MFKKYKFNDLFKNIEGIQLTEDKWDETWDKMVEAGIIDAKHHTITDSKGEFSYIHENEFIFKDPRGKGYINLNGLFSFRTIFTEIEELKNDK